MGSIMIWKGKGKAAPDGISHPKLPHYPNSFGD